MSTWAAIHLATVNISDNTGLYNSEKLTISQLAKYSVKWLGEGISQAQEPMDVFVTCISSFLSSSMYLCVCSCSCRCSVFIGTLILTLSFLLRSKYMHITTSGVIQSNFIQCQVYTAINWNSFSLTQQCCSSSNPS